MSTLFAPIDVHATELAQRAAHDGPAFSSRPVYDSSPNGLAFRAGLWARSAGIPVQEARMSRGYTVIINRRYKVNLKNEPPIVTLAS